LNESMESKSKDLLETFIHEVLVYREPLSLALKETLGDQDSRNVMKDLTALEEKGGYISDPEVARQLGAFFVGREEDLGFYVLSSYDSQIRLEIKENGEINHAMLKLFSRPIFLYWPKAIAHKSSELKELALPPYFTPWVHEFGHFLCYCLQKKPIMVAMNILVGSISQSGYVFKNMRDLLRLSQENVSPLIWESARLLVQWSAINEAMAVWWEDHLLKAMGFDATVYVDRKKDGNPYLAQLEVFNKAKVIEYMQNWCSPDYYPETFTINFLHSFSRMTIDKWSFLDR